jgi:hypothetical protein
MQITSAPRTSPTRAANTAPQFNYNPQDPETLPNDVISVGKLSPNGGKLATETQVLDNKKAIFIGGQLVGFRPDPKYKIKPNEDGNYVFPQGHPSFTGANAFGAIDATIQKYNQVLGELTGKSIEWSFGDKQIKVSPETGEWPNAFYARQLKGLHFFDYKTTSTADSGEVASHETGHALLDAQRPGYMEGSGTETGAFHEAFGDVLAMLMTLGNEKAVEAIVAQTDGDLSTRRNMLSDMGEAFGNAAGKPGGIRTAFNSFVYADPANLPESGDEDHLGREIHDFSRLWTGAFYDVIDGIADANRAAGMSPKEALMAAGEESFKLFVGQMENSSASSETTFKEMAVNLLAGDAQFNGGQRQELITNVMRKRELLSGQEAPPPARLAARPFSGEVVEQQFTFGPEAGPLAGVKMTSKVEKSTMGLVENESSVLSEAQKGARLMVADGKVLFADEVPDFVDFFKPNGEVYSAYVAPNAAGEREFHRVPMAFCDFGHGPDQVHDHSHHHH